MLLAGSRGNHHRRSARWKIVLEFGRSDPHWLHSPVRAADYQGILATELNQAEGQFGSSAGWALHVATSARRTSWPASCPWHRDIAFAAQARSQLGERQVTSGSRRARARRCLHAQTPSGRVARRWGCPDRRTASEGSGETGLGETQARRRAHRRQAGRGRGRGAGETRDVVVGDGARAPARRGSSRGARGAGLFEGGLLVGLLVGRRVDSRRSK